MAAKSTPVVGLNEWQLDGGPRCGVVNSQVRSYLRDYGYETAGHSVWKDKPKDRGPRLDINVSEHFEKSGHTWYVLRCSLNYVTRPDRTSSEQDDPPGGRLEWYAPRRLCQLREGMHDIIKDELGGHYQRDFSNATFASRGGIPGTTARLDAWLKILAQGINSGRLAPKFASLTLRFLNTPNLPWSTSRREGYPSGGYPHDGSIFFGPNSRDRPRRPSAPPLAPSNGTRSRLAPKEMLASVRDEDVLECYDDLPARGLDNSVDHIKPSDFDSDDDIEERCNGDLRVTSGAAPILRGPSNDNFLVTSEEAPVLRSLSNASVVRSTSRLSNAESYRVTGANDRGFEADEIEAVDLCEDDV